MNASESLQLERFAGVFCFPLGVALIRRALLFVLSIFDDLLYLGGAICVVTGVGKIYEPAGWIAAGVFLIVGSVLVGREMSEKEISDGIDDANP